MTPPKASKRKDDATIMSVDRHGMSHKAKGSADGGQYEPKRGVGGDDDLDSRMAADLAAWDFKTRIERMAAEGNGREATRLARLAGAYAPGDRIPYMDGVQVAVWDGRGLSTGMVHGGQVVEDYFNPSTIHVPVD